MGAGMHNPLKLMAISGVAILTLNGAMAAEMTVPYVTPSSFQPEPVGIWDGVFIGVLTTSKPRSDRIPTDKILTYKKTMALGNSFFRHFFH